MTAWLIDTLIVTGLLMALVLVIRRPVAQMFGPGLAYALWAIPLVRLALPPLILPSRPTAREPLVMDTFAQDGGAATLVAAPGGQTIEVWPLLLQALPWLWLAGAVCFIAWRRITYVRMRERLLCGAKPMGEAGRVRIVESPAVTVPVAFGVIDPVIALPPEFLASPDRRARDLALAHEFEHHAAHDLAANMAMQALLAFHWFNPIAWMGWRAMRRDQEAACDARVIAGRDTAVRAEYARLIAAFAGGPRLGLAAPMAAPFGLGALLGEKSVIHRLRTLALPAPSTARRRTGSGLVCAALLALPLTATVSYASADRAGAIAPIAIAAPAALPVPVASPEPKAAFAKATRGAPNAPAAQAPFTAPAVPSALIATTVPIAPAAQPMASPVTLVRASWNTESLEARLEAEAEARAEAHEAAMEAHAEALEHAAERRAEALEAAAEARAEALEAAAEARADAQRIRAEARHTVRASNNQAVAALQRVRADIAGNPGMPTSVRRSIMAEIDHHIARIVGPH